MSDKTLVSYAQNGEDVVLWRALGHVSSVRYVDVGACDPVELSVTKVFYDRGARGRYRRGPGTGRPDAAQAARRRRGARCHHRSGSRRDGPPLVRLDRTVDARRHGRGPRRQPRIPSPRITVPVIRLDASCARLGGDGHLHFLKIDVEGAEAEVLRSFDLARWRPWVVVVEATVPNSLTPTRQEWDPILTEAGYVFTLFDGLSRWYRSPEHPELVAALSYPACVLDRYTAARQQGGPQADRARVELNGHLHAQQPPGRPLRWRDEAASTGASRATVQVSEAATTHARREADGIARQRTRARHA